MKGNVIGFDADTNTGAISGYDDKRYDFASVDWQGHGAPRHGDVVDFTPDNKRATQIFLLEPVYLQPNFGHFYFSPAGRISRSQFWLRWIVPIAITFVVLGAIVGGIVATNVKGTPEEVMIASIAAILMYALFFEILTIWPDVVVLTKRIHDRGKPGWLVLFCLVPRVLYFLPLGTLGVIAGLVGLVVFFWFLTEFGCLRGTIGANRYGPDPVPH